MVTLLGFCKRRQNHSSVPGESPLRIEAADGELSGYDIAITNEVIEVIANQSRWVTFGNAPVFGLREMLADINPGTGSSSPSYLTNVNGTLFFSANELKYGRELWKSDGTSAGTTLFKDINPGSSSLPSYLTSKRYFFSANDDDATLQRNRTQIGRYIRSTTLLKISNGL